MFDNVYGIIYCNKSTVFSCLMYLLLLYAGLCSGGITPFDWWSLSCSCFLY